MLDPQGRDEVIRIVEELKRNTGLTVISITHDLGRGVTRRSYHCDE